MVEFPGPGKGKRTQAKTGGLPEVGDGFKNLGKPRLTEFAGQHTEKEMCVHAENLGSLQRIALAYTVEYELLHAFEKTTTTQKRTTEKIRSNGSRVRVAGMK